MVISGTARKDQKGGGGRKGWRRRRGRRSRGSCRGESAGVIGVDEKLPACKSSRLLQLIQPIVHLSQHILVLTSVDTLVKFVVCSFLFLIILVVVLLTFSKRTHTARQTVLSVKQSQCKENIRPYRYGWQPYTQLSLHKILK